MFLKFGSIVQLLSYKCFYVRISYVGELQLCSICGNTHTHTQTHTRKMSMRMRVSLNQHLFSFLYTYLLFQQGPVWLGQVFLLCSCWMTGQSLNGLPYIPWYTSHVGDHLWTSGGFGRSSAPQVLLEWPLMQVDNITTNLLQHTAD